MKFLTFLTFFRAYTYLEMFLLPILMVILKVKTAGCFFSWLLMIWIWAASYFYNSLLNRLNQYMVNLANSAYHEWSVLWEVYCETFFGLYIITRLLTQEKKQSNYRLLLENTNIVVTFFWWHFKGIFWAFEKRNIV